jgi:choline dehydrogenase-like flavoprotein
MSSSPDVVIIGSGIGGGTLAYRLVRHGLSVTILERGGYLPQEPDNWDVCWRADGRAQRGLVDYVGGLAGQ